MSQYAEAVERIKNELVQNLRTHPDAVRAWQDLAAQTIADNRLSFSAWCDWLHQALHTAVMERLAELGVPTEDEGVHQAAYAGVVAAQNDAGWPESMPRCTTESYSRSAERAGLAVGKPAARGTTSNLTKLLWFVPLAYSMWITFRPGGILNAD